MKDLICLGQGEIALIMKMNSKLGDFKTKHLEDSTTVNTTHTGITRAVNHMKEVLRKQNKPVSIMGRLYSRESVELIEDYMFPAIAKMMPGVFVTSTTTEHINNKIVL